MRIPRLREWRERRALIQVDLAEKAGVSPRTVAGLEAGGSARLDTVRKLANALGVGVEDLYAEPKPDRRLAEVQEKYRHHAEELEAYCERFGSGQENPEEFFADLPAKVFELGGLYEGELRDIADALGLAERYGAASGLPDAVAVRFARAEMQERSLMRVALQTYYATGRALAESLGDAERAEVMRRMGQTFAGAAA